MSLARPAWALLHKRDHTTAGATSHAHQDAKGKEEETGEEEEKLGGVGGEREMKRSKEAEGEKGGEKQEENKEEQEERSKSPFPDPGPRAHAHTYHPCLKHPKSPVRPGFSNQSGHLNLCRAGSRSFWVPSDSPIGRSRNFPLP